MHTTPTVTGDPPDRADLVIAVVLLVALGLIAPVFSFFGMMFGMVSDGCMGSASCNSDQIMLGVLVAAAAPWIALVGGITAVVLRVRRRRRVWWVPLVAALIGAGLFVAGAIIADTAVR